jgi:hypothetical protein
MNECSIGYAVQSIFLVTNTNKQVLIKMKKIFLKTLALGIGLAGSFASKAQYQMLVQSVGGTSDSYAVSDIRSIKFNDSEMFVNQNNGSVATYAIADIDQYMFAQSSAIGASETEAHTLTLFPNPAEDKIEIVYSIQHPEKITIELTDPFGRRLALIYEGVHQGKQSYKFPLQLSAGVYFCRITAEAKTINKPIVIR